MTTPQRRAIRLVVVPLVAALATSVVFALLTLLFHADVLTYQQARHPGTDPAARPRNRRAALVLVLLAPLVAEVSLGTAPLREAWVMPIYLPIYGAGALFLREILRRTGGGWANLLLLGVAYGGRDRSRGRRRPAPHESSGGCRRIRHGTGRGQRRLAAVNRASRMAASGAFPTPVNCSNWLSAWASSRSSPDATGTPAAVAAAASGVGHGS